MGAFFAPLLIVGRNVPVAALIPLTFSLFGIDEFQKVMFIFIACVAFVMSDSARAVNDIGDRYIDTAYTLGASRRQVILKVLFPLGVARHFQFVADALRPGLRLHHAGRGGGGGRVLGLGGNHQPGPAPRAPDLYPFGADDYPPGGPGHRPDALLDSANCCPYRYGCSGILHEAVRRVLCLGEDARSLVFRPKPSVPPTWKTPT